MLKMRGSHCWLLLAVCFCLMVAEGKRKIKREDYVSVPSEEETNYDEDDYDEVRLAAI